MSTNRVLSMLRKHSGSAAYHPLCSLYDLADEVDATIPDKINIHKSIAKYCEAENKSIELVGAENMTPISMSINIDGNTL